MILSGLFVFAQQGKPAAQPPAPQGNMLTALLPFILVFVIFYLLIIMPQRKKQKKQQAQIGALKPGDRVITSSGIYGTVVGVQPDKIEVKIAANVIIKVTKGAIGVILGKEDGAAEKTE